jgi:hypothetical protein
MQDYSKFHKLDTLFLFWIIFKDIYEEELTQRDTEKTQSYTEFSQCHSVSR